MIRLPSPPRKMTAPAPPIDFLNKFNEVITFQQNLSSALEQQQIANRLDYSIVVPAYNEESYLGEVLDILHLGMSKLPNLKGEIIVVDNNSTDQTGKKCTVRIHICCACSYTYKSS